MNAIIVARVSTEDQKITGSSLPAQLMRLKNYCVSKGYTITHSFSFDETAFKLKRDEFDNILSIVNKTKEKTIVCFDKVDRFSRNPFDKRVSQLYEKAVRNEIELHFISDGQIIDADMNAGDKFAFGMKLGLAKYYSDAISDNVKRVFELKRANGEWTGKVRLGYLSVSADEKKRLRRDIILDKTRAHLIKKMFELYSTGNYSITSIKTIMSELGLRSKKGTVIPKSGFHNMLGDSFYCGIAFSPKYGSYAHRYPRLITTTLYEKCQALLRRKAVVKATFSAKDFLFRGFFTCRLCGCSITGELKRKRNGNEYTYYSCTNSKRNCKREYISEPILLACIDDLLVRFGSVPVDLSTRLIAELKKEFQPDLDFKNGQILRIKSEIESLSEKHSRLLELYIDQSISKETYQTKQAEYQNKIESLNCQLKDDSNQGLKIVDGVKSVVELSAYLRQIFISSEIPQKREILNLLFQNSTISGKKPEFIIRFPFNLLVNFTGCPVLLPNLDEIRNYDLSLLTQEIEDIKARFPQYFKNGKVIQVPLLLPPPHD